MKISSSLPKTIVAIVFFTGIVFLFNSCRKTMDTEELRPENNEANKELLELFAQKYKNQPKTFTESSNGGPCFTNPDGTWITESWYISI